MPSAGVSITGNTTAGVTILGNRVGTDFTGTNALGNGTFGVLVSGTPGVSIGGTVTGSRNIISANTTAGIGLYAGTTGTLVENNLIGTDLTGSVPLGNGDGILIDGSSANNTIGGIAAGAGNTIAFSNGAGVDVDASAGSGNEIRLNAIFSNTGLGIELGTGITAGGQQSGPNDSQIFPTLTSLVSSGGETTIHGGLSSATDTTYTIDFYTLSSLNPSGYGEGRYVLGSTTLTTGPTGDADFVFNFPTPATGAEFVSATVTDPNGNTSEFAKDVGIEIPPVAVIGFTSLTINAGESVPFDGLGSLDPSGTRSQALLVVRRRLDGDGARADSYVYDADPDGHSYHAGTPDIVTLTVSDGFGGTSTARAYVTVNDVAPVFTPDSYTAPLTYTSKSPSDGFGESVATDDGNVAIGARRPAAPVKSTCTTACPPMMGFRQPMPTGN